ncbi:MAG: ABC transporter substrate-binding protein [Desulfobacteraceae bacterium]|nr:MAG: ABC transporter substrate-binding protein [Desulfobacteraceae bacterium]
MKMFFLLLATVLSPVTASSGESASLYPPWKGERNPSAEKGIVFQTGDIDNMPDFHGNPTTAEFVIFAGGNYFFALDELVAAFEKEHPELRGKIFYETIPPGVVARQMENGNTITLGNFTLSIQPDIVQAGKNQIREMAAKGMVEGPGVDFISNRLAIMVQKGNPLGISSLSDLGKPGVRLANPNPETEGIAKKIQQALRNAGGEDLVTEVYEKKVKRGEAFLTQIHHRQTPLWIMQGKADAGVVWVSEGLFQEMIDHPLESVSIEDAHNEEGVEAAAIVRNARNPRTAGKWLEFVRSERAVSIIEKYGMESPR